MPLPRMMRMTVIAPACRRVGMRMSLKALPVMPVMVVRSRQEPATNQVGDEGDSGGHDLVHSHGRSNTVPAAALRTARRGGSRGGHGNRSQNKPTAAIGNAEPRGGFRRTSRVFHANRQKSSPGSISGGLTHLGAPDAIS